MQIRGRVVRRAHDGRVPDAALLIEHRIVRVRLAVPDRFVAPVRATAASAACCSSSACSDPATGAWMRRRGVRLRIEDRELVGRELGRAVELAVGVDRRIAAVGAAQVVHVGLVGRPIAHRRDDVALDAARPLRLRMRQLALRDALGPIGEILRRHAAELIHRGRRASGCRPDRTECAAPTRRDGSAWLANSVRQRARRELADLMAADARQILDRREVLIDAARQRARPRSPCGTFIIEYQ